MNYTLKNSFQLSLCRSHLKGLDLIWKGSSVHTPFLLLFWAELLIKNWVVQSWKGPQLNKDLNLLCVGIDDRSFVLVDDTLEIGLVSLINMEIGSAQRWEPKKNTFLPWK